MYVNTGKTSIADDWNFAISCVDTDLVTLAHQDDIYEKDYLKYILKGYKKLKALSFYLLIMENCEMIKSTKK